MIRATILILGLSLATSSIAADENKASAFDGFRKKIEQLTPKKKLQTTTAVGGVRGDLAADAGALYWKGEMAEQTIDAEELTAFEEALTLAEAGNKTPAEKSLNDFLKKYPDSQLKPDAEQALALLKTETHKP